MIPFAPPIFEADCRQSPPQRQRTNRFAFVLFAFTALVGLAIKYLL
jgi:hypothetical protein